MGYVLAARKHLISELHQNVQSILEYTIRCSFLNWNKSPYIVSQFNINNTSCPCLIISNYKSTKNASNLCVINYQ